MAKTTPTTEQGTGVQRKRIAGIVVSDKGAKTVIVRVDRYVKHPRVGKYIRRSKRIAAHDEQETYGVGDAIWIEECRPMSKTKRFKVAGLRGETA